MTGHAALEASELFPPLRKMQIRWDGMNAPYNGKALHSLSAARFGWTRSGGTQSHGGVDLAAAVGTPVYAIADGYVEEVHHKNGNYGGTVLLAFLPRPAYVGFGGITDGAVLYALYAHLKPGSIRVRRGQEVTGGKTVLAETGISGNGDQRYPHLHFEVRRVRYAGYTSTTQGMDNRIDPEVFFAVDFIEPYTAMSERARTA